MKHTASSSSALSNLATSLALAQSSSPCPKTDTLRQTPTIQSPNFNLEHENMMLKQQISELKNVIVDLCKKTHNQAKPTASSMAKQRSARKNPKLQTLTSPTAAILQHPSMADPKGLFSPPTRLCASKSPQTVSHSHQKSIAAPASLSKDSRLS